MFTGIVERIGTIRETRVASGGRRMRIDVGDMARDCALGSSICVSGVCLTVTETCGDELSFDVVKETTQRSTLSRKRVGDRVNLERSLRASDRLDGHFVQGHIDGTAIVDRVQNSPSEYLLWLRPDAALRPYIIPKGSVAVDGVSLTIATVAGVAFGVAVIPATLEKTTLSSLAAGDLVNIETDIIARTVIHWLTELPRQEQLTLEALQKAGFA